MVTRMCISLDPETAARLKILAHDQYMSVSKLITKWVEHTTTKDERLNELQKKAAHNN